MPPPRARFSLISCYSRVYVDVWDLAGRPFRPANHFLIESHRESFWNPCWNNRFTQCTAGVAEARRLWHMDNRLGLSLSANAAAPSPSQASPAPPNGLPIFGLFFRLIAMHEPILVTGAAGFIGFHVARRLLEDGRCRRPR